MYLFPKPFLVGLIHPSTHPFIHPSFCLFVIFPPQFPRPSLLPAPPAPRWWRPRGGWGGKPRHLNAGAGGWQAYNKDQAKAGPNTKSCSSVSAV